MSLALKGLSVTASDLGTFEDCPARYYHSQQGYRSLLPTDRTAADVSSAFHDALMQFYRQLELQVLRGELPSPTEASRQLRMLVDRHLFRKRLSRSDPKVSSRLAQLDAGLERAATLIVGDAARWGIDPITGDLLVWQEPPLDHGPEVRAVEMAPSTLVRTRPDVIGLQVTQTIWHQPVVRDYKARAEIVDPAFDTGIQVRGIWALLEARNPRCRWFLADRAIQVDAESVVLETVNLMHAGSDDFLLTSTMSAEQLLEHRTRIIDTMAEMGDIVRAKGPDDVPASPSPFCLRWCPFLNRCRAGVAHVRKYHGQNELQARLGEI